MRAILVFAAMLFAACAFGAECPAPQGARVAGEEAVAFLAGHGARIGLALGSGSAHGFAHVGVIREIEALGLEVDVVSGTSVGALFGALWASGLSGAQIEQIARAADWNDMGRFAPSREGLFTNRDLHDELSQLFAGRPIETWPRRFAAVATNLDNGHARLLMSGDGALAVQASSAVPIVFRPVSIGGERLVDGALVEPVPVEAARAMGADVVIGVDVAYRPYEERVNGVTGYAFQSMHILINALAARDLGAADVAIRLDVHERLMQCGPEALIAAGREAVRRAAPDIARAIRLRTASR